MRQTKVAAWVVLLLAVCTQAETSTNAVAPAVTAPPESFFNMVHEDSRKAARQFYTKYVDVKGLPVAASGEVADLALQRTHEIVAHMLAGRPDVLQAMVDDGMYLIVIGKDQVYTDMPEYRDSPNPAFQNERVRGTGGLPTSFGEENLLSLPVDRYDDESIAVHEFCHTIDGTLEQIDPTWRQRKRDAYDHARKNGLYYNTYAGSNAGEYWAEIAQAYFDCNRINNWNHGPIGHREQLRVYDPVGYELCRATFNLSPEQDWRYKWLQKLPNVTTPPARFKIDPFYTKFTWAREFTVLGRQASDEALLQANETIRRMFAYRHDILKSLIADGVKLVVLGPDEHISDLPEYKRLSDPNAVDALSRYLTYTPEMKLLVVGQENVLANPRDMYVGDCQIVRVFADAIYRVAGTRPVDPNFESRPRYIWQQYELRVQRLDERFDAKLKETFEKSIAAGRWQGAAAIAGRAAYWTEGVLAYFDALGQDDVPNDAVGPVNTQEKLKEYDPDLFALVNETMAYQGQIDWRYKPYEP
ncbi:MAG: hypothetical protein ACM3VT_00875 [Solirubrobacterales bacterium]